MNPATSLPAVELGVMEGYSRWAKTYDSSWNTLIATEELYSLPLLDEIAAPSRSGF